MEVYNDIDSSLVNFFNVIRRQPEELFKQLDFSLYSREVFCSALKNMESGTDIERTCNFYIVNRQYFGGRMKMRGIATSGSNGFFEYERQLREAHQRIQTVYIENLDWREVIQRYDCPEALFYCDPPYIFNGTCGNDKLYANEMTNADHAELVEILKHIKGKFLLSGCINDLYDYFDRISIGEVNICVNKKVAEQRIKKQEYIWKNF